MNKKNIIKSKTFWLNLTIAIIPFFSNHAAERIAEAPEQFTAVWGVVNMLLRWVTNDKVVLRD